MHFILELSVNLTVKRIESIDFSDKNELHGAKNDKNEEIIQSKRKIKIIRIDSDARKSEKAGEDGEEPR